MAKKTAAARFAVARGVMRLAKAIAPCAISGVGQARADDRHTAYLLAIGTDPYEAGAALMTAGERVVSEFEKAGL